MPNGARAKFCQQYHQTFPGRPGPPDVGRRGLGQAGTGMLRMCACSVAFPILCGNGNTRLSDWTRRQQLTIEVKQLVIKIN